MKKNENIEYLNKLEHYTVDDLRRLVELLRGEGGCPWDREQTHKSIRSDFIEETYEVIEAIDTENTELLREELGDVLLQVIFHTQIEAENGNFTLCDVTSQVCRKLIHRHPHVFGDTAVSSTPEVLSNWEKIKSQEKSRHTITDKLRAIPPALPALMRAAKVGRRASCFDFPDAMSVMNKVYEEADEVSCALSLEDKTKIEEEIGDLLLTICSLARKTEIDPEAALNRATDKFIDRFSKVEDVLRSTGLNPEHMSMIELNNIWEKIK